MKYNDTDIRRNVPSKNQNQKRMAKRTKQKKNGREMYDVCTMLSTYQCVKCNTNII